jgi:hypothetical protein
VKKEGPRLRPGCRTGSTGCGSPSGISLGFHALLLKLHFQFPDASRAMQEKAMDIILVNAKSARKPHDAQALAQANLDGGGNTDENRRAKTPLAADAAADRRRRSSKCSAACRNWKPPSRNC